MAFHKTHEPPCRVALLDCNNFFASCEQIQNPCLWGKPIVVLSSNDGCVISRSEEARAYGVDMGVPAHTIRQIVKDHKIISLSGNYQLYIDMSARVMLYLRNRLPEVEIYSVDEAFMNLTGMERFYNLTQLMTDLRRDILRDLGLPVSIGIAPNKTLSKIANRLAKRRKGNYVVSLLTHEAQKAALIATPIKEVWGIGWRLGTKMTNIGITSAWDLSQISDSQMRRLSNVVGVRMIRELRGESSYHFELERPARKTILVSRSFGQELDSLADLESAMTYFVGRASDKLLRQRSVAGALSVFTRTNRFKDGEPYRPEKHVVLPLATAYPPLLRHEAINALKAIYNPEFRYKKAGILLSDIRPQNGHQVSLFDAPERLEKEIRLLETLHRLNHDRSHKERLVTWADFLFAERNKRWQPRSEHRSNYVPDDDLKDEDRNLNKMWW